MLHVNVLGWIVQYFSRFGMWRLATERILCCNVNIWFSGVILALNVRGPEFNYRNAPIFSVSKLSSGVWFSSTRQKCTAFSALVFHIYLFLYYSLVCLSLTMHKALFCFLSQKIKTFCFCFFHQKIRRRCESVLTIWLH